MLYFKSLLLNAQAPANYVDAIPGHAMLPRERAFTRTTHTSNIDRPEIIQSNILVYFTLVANALLTHF